MGERAAQTAVSAGHHGDLAAEGEGVEHCHRRSWSRVAGVMVAGLPLARQPV
jgi:hypothetical protein